MLYLIIVVMVALAVTLSVMGHRWESRVTRPMSNRKPLVSILIPAYKSADTIEETLRSVKKIDYPKKEIIVINDPPDESARICKRLGVRCLTPKKRLGKARALNLAAKQARGDFLFFVDADTTVDRDILTTSMPWFSKEKVAIVQPRFTVRNKGKNLITRLAAIENFLVLSFLKTNMYFGTLLGFRGCGVVMRKSVFNELNGWEHTLAEDIDMGAKVVDAGYTIQYEPAAYIQTDEPASLRELKRQKVRWGKGSLFSFLSYRSHFMDKGNLRTILIYAFPYLFLFFASTIFILYNMVLYIPFLFLIFSVSFTQIAFAALFVIVPVFSSFFATIYASALGHTVVLSSVEKEEAMDVLFSIPYILFYVPIITAFYFLGIATGIRQAMKTRSIPELNLKDW